MFVKLYKQRRKHGRILSAVLGENERDEFRGHRFIYHRMLASIRESDLNDGRALYTFWHNVRYILHINKYSIRECENIFNTLGRSIPRPRRIIGSTSGIYFLFYHNCHTHRGRRNH